MNRKSRECRLRDAGDRKSFLRQIVLQTPVFDSRGTFISLVFSAPLLLNALAIVSTCLPGLRCPPPLAAGPVLTASARFFPGPQWVRKTLAVMTDLRSLREQRRRAGARGRGHGPRRVTPLRSESLLIPWNTRKHAVRTDAAYHTLRARRA